MAARVSQAGLLAVEQGAPTARVSQAGVLAVEQGAPTARVSQVGMLVVYPSPAGRTAAYFSVLREHMGEVG